MSELALEPFERYAVGQSVARTEDPRLLRGAGQFTDDLNLLTFLCIFTPKVLLGLDSMITRLHRSTLMQTLCLRNGG